MCKTSNPSERTVIKQLEEQGYSVMRKGWPDLLAVKDGKVRLIEVKPMATSSGKASRSDLITAQREVARILSLLGITVELVRA